MFGSGKPDLASLPENEEHVKALRSSALALGDRYIVSGALPLPAAAPAVKVKGAFGELVAPASLNTARAQLAALSKSCKPAPFGHGRETVVDPTVRQALALPAAEFSVEGIDPAAWAQLLETIRVTLVPDAAEIVAELDKLNLYMLGGHFASHRDTPGDRSHFGTLVVCLPIIFAGGDLAVSHHGDRTVLNWDRFVIAGRETTSSYVPTDYELRKASGEGSYYGGNQAFEQSFNSVAAKTPKATLYYAAFFGHCEHEIAKVTYGARVTLAYKLRRQGVSAVPLPLPLAASGGGGGGGGGAEAIDTGAAVRANAFAQALRNAVADRDFLPDGGKLGFACFHLYEDEELPDGTVDLKSREGLLLKGADYVVAAAAAALGLEVSVVRLVSSDDTRYAVDHFPASKDPKLYATKVHLESSLVWGGVRSAWGAEEDTIPDKLGRGDEEAVANAVWVVELPNGSRGEIAPCDALEPIWFSGTGYFGNEASQTTFYTHAALLISIPGDGPARDAVVGGAAPTSEAEEGNDRDGTSTAATPASGAATSGAPLQPAAATALVDALVRHKRRASDGSGAAYEEARVVHQRLQLATLPTLKEVLRSIKAPVSGSKTVLIERATANIAKITNALLDGLGAPSAPVEKRARSGGHDDRPRQVVPSAVFEAASAKWHAAFFA